MKKFSHGLVAVNENKEILHFVGYWNEPTVVDIQEINKELRIDEELGLVGKEFTVERAAPSVVIHFNNVTGLEE